MELGRGRLVEDRHERFGGPVSAHVSVDLVRRVAVLRCDQLQRSVALRTEGLSTNEDRDHVADMAIERYSAQRGRDRLNTPLRTVLTLYSGLKCGALRSQRELAHSTHNWPETLGVVILAVWVRANRARGRLRRRKRHKGADRECLVWRCEASMSALTRYAVSQTRRRIAQWARGRARCPAAILFASSRRRD